MVALNSSQSVELNSVQLEEIRLQMSNLTQTFTVFFLFSEFSYLSQKYEQYQDQGENSLFSFPLFLSFLESVPSSEIDEFYRLLKEFKDNFCNFQLVVRQFL